MLEGDESLRSWRARRCVQRMEQRGAGLCRAAKLSLLVPTVASQVLIMPWMSHSYGMIAITRYTSHVDAAALGGHGDAG